MKGQSNHAMEDYVVSEIKQVGENELGLFAIFDGHLGHDVANYLQTHLFNNILKEVSLAFGFNFPLLAMSSTAFTCNHCFLQFL